MGQRLHCCPPRLLRGEGAAVQAPTGNLEVDQHHTVEDVGICLGQAIRQALG
ncbi:MAG: hypothetical protein HQ582_31005, partial [Planctomycetes bacterium]|nr:hypothetical protein [Planctomycetota bacterium]